MIIALPAQEIKTLNSAEEYEMKRNNAFPPISDSSTTFQRKALLSFGGFLVFIFSSNSIILNKLLFPVP